jgi:hypothetical protein
VKGRLRVTAFAETGIGRTPRAPGPRTLIVERLRLAALRMDNYRVISYTKERANGKQVQTAFAMEGMQSGAIDGKLACKNDVTRQNFLSTASAAGGSACKPRLEDASAGV